VATPSLPSAPSDFQSERAIVTARDGDATERYVLGGGPEWLEDNFGTFWYLSRSPNSSMWADPWHGPCAIFGSAGIPCTMTLIPLREVPKDVRQAIRYAPDGAMSSVLSRKVPLCVPLPSVKAAVDRIYVEKQALCHPHLVTPVPYSLSMEGGVVMVDEYSPCGTLRELHDRYGDVRPLTTARFCLDILSGLIALHNMGIFHGMLSLDSVLVDANGTCRPRHHLWHSPSFQNLFHVPVTCSVTPSMAAGKSPTLQRDIFCYGLLCIEAIACRP
jgi:hypothetical protein